MVGQTIGKYRIGDLLGRGGMGTVYRAVDEILHREVAIKALNAGLNDPGIGRRFRAEAVAIARLNHPGIAMIYELVEHEGQWLMVIEYVRGETLDSLVLRSGQLGPTHAVDLTVQVLSALAHAHSMGVVHRDLKPQNIMITETGATKVMDFGIARVAGTEHLTSAGFLMGTPAYMAPEQVMGGEVDTRTDLYSIGVVLYYLLTAKLPFKGDTPMVMAQSRVRDLPTPIRAIRQDLPAWISLIMERALERAADRRYQSADEMRDALRRGLSGLPVAAAAPMLTPPELIVSGPLANPTWATNPPAPTNPTNAADHDTAAMMVVFPPPRLNPQTAAASMQGEAIQPAVPSPTPSLSVPSPAPSLPPAAPPTAAPAVAAAAKASSKKVSTPAIAAIAAGVVVLLIAGALVARGLRTAPLTAPAEIPPALPPPATVVATPPVEPRASTPDPTAATRPGTANPPSPPTASAHSATSVAPPGTPPPSGTPGARSVSGVGPKAGPPTGTAAGPGTGAPGTGTATSLGAGAGGPPATGTPSATPTGSAPTGPGRSARGVSTAPSTVTGTPTDTVLKVDNIKQLEVVGRNGTERDASIYLGGGMISLIGRTGTTIAAVQYGDLASATHTHAKDPKWDPALPGPPSNLDVPGGMFRSAKHWLALQSKTQYFVLRLEDGNWKHVVETLEARTGIRVTLASR